MGWDGVLADAAVQFGDRRLQSRAGAVQRLLDAERLARECHQCRPTTIALGAGMGCASVGLEGQPGAGHP